MCSACAGFAVGRGRLKIERSASMLSIKAALVRYSCNADHHCCYAASSSLQRRRIELELRCREGLLLWLNQFRLRNQACAHRQLEPCLTLVLPFSVGCAVGQWVKFTKSGGDEVGHRASLDLPAVLCPVTVIPGKADRDRGKAIIAHDCHKKEGTAQMQP